MINLLYIISVIAGLFVFSLGMENEGMTAVLMMTAGLSTAISNIAFFIISEVRDMQR